MQLRQRAADKFGDLAERMYFTPDGLEQATRLPVATHRAARLRAADTATLIDLGCGIGGDLVAYARAGITCAGVDLDPVRVAVAVANLDGARRSAGPSRSPTRPRSTPPPSTWPSPTRRAGRRAGAASTSTTGPRRGRFVETLLGRDSCVKVAPGIPHDLVPDGVEAEWVSDHREVKEAVLWSARLATARRRATVIGDGGLATLTDEDDPGAAHRAARPPSSTSPTAR